MTRAEHQASMREICLIHLTACGYPDMSADDIYREVPVLWALLLRAGLVPPQASHAFAEAAVKAYSDATYD